MDMYTAKIKRIIVFLFSIYLFISAFLVERGYATQVEDLSNLTYHIELDDNLPYIHFTFSIPDDFKDIFVTRNGKAWTVSRDYRGQQPFAWDSNIEDNQTYTYTFQVINQAGELSKGVSLTVKVGNVLAPLAPVVDSRWTHDTVYFDFHDIRKTYGSSDFSHYEVYKNNQLIGTSKGGTYTVTGLKGNTSYTFCFKSVDTGGVKSRCGGETLTTKPYPVSNLKINKLTPTTFKITWDINSNPEGLYYVWEFYDGEGVYLTSGLGKNALQQYMEVSKTKNSGIVKPNTKYIFAVWAQTDSGLKSTVEHLTFTTPNNNTDASKKSSEKSQEIKGQEENIGTKSTVDPKNDKEVDKISTETKNSTEHDETPDTETTELNVSETNETPSDLEVISKTEEGNNQEVHSMGLKSNNKEQIEVKEENKLALPFGLSIIILFGIVVTFFIFKNGRIRTSR